MKKIWNKNIKIMLILILDIVIISGSTYAATTYLFNSVEVGYDNASSGLLATNVQGALDELYTKSTDYSDVITRLSALENKNVALDIYPIGSIFIGTQNTNPSTFLGGTWERFGKGKTLVSLDEDDESFDTIEEAGGAKSISYTPSGSVGNHTLTIAEMPSHSHDIIRNSGAVLFTEVKTVPQGGYYSVTADWGPGIKIGNTGGGGAHNHPWTGTAATLNVMDPYITVYMWKRTA